MELKREDIVAAAKELNETLGLEPAIDIKLGRELLIYQVLEAVPLIEPDDDISESTRAVLVILQEESQKEAQEEGEKFPLSEGQFETASKSTKSAPESLETLSARKIMPLSGVLAGCKKATLSARIDEIIVEGGSWSVVMEKVATATEESGTQLKWTRARVRDHVRRRLQRGWVDVGFPGIVRISVTSDGIEVDRNEEQSSEEGVYEGQ